MPCIKEDRVHRELGDIQRILQSLREQKTGELMGHFLALELGGGLPSIPVINTQLSNIHIQSI